MIPSRPSADPAIQYQAIKWSSMQAQVQNLKQDTKNRYAEQIEHKREIDCLTCYQNVLVHVRRSGGTLAPSLATMLMKLKPELKPKPKLKSKTKTIHA